MTDPLDALREPVVLITPDPRFAAALRARLERAVIRGDEMSATQTTAGHVGYASVWLPDIERAETFYRAVLGWSFAPGSIEHGRQIEDVRPRMGMAGGVEHSSLFLAHAVPDVRAAVRRIHAAGGQADEPVQQPYGLISDCVDDQGLRFSVYEGAADVPAQSRPGELVYITVEVPDTARFRAFYGAVFGWTFTPGRINDGWGVNEARPMMGVHRAGDRPTILPMYQVTDIQDAVGRVRRAGGTAVDPAQRPYGLESLCSDDQGSRFYLGQF
ncbi:MAG TPA: VOC family protein [Pseudonocardiaceae bacterium]|jgi:predicted enzyme related to lactoylglutathione lyase|nr:VOC family protein [Pseudonocardiaceae bacterium]